MSGIITTCAGGFGRFGNAMFQYAVARTYAESIGAELRTIDWIGRKIFQNINEPLIGDLELPQLPDENLDGRTNVHLRGYFQRPHHLAMLSRKKLKQWFRPKPRYQKQGHDLVFHKRRGDYINAGCYALITDKSYEDGAKQFGFHPSNAMVYSDDRPVDSTYDDFFEIVASRAIFRANSSYSWWAATLSDARVFAPVVGERTGWLDAEFIEGNHPQTYYLFGDLKIGE